MRLCIWGVREEESKETETMLCQEAKRKEVTRVSHSRKVVVVVGWLSTLFPWQWGTNKDEASQRPGPQT